MAKQKGILTLEGKAGKLSFIHGRNGFTVRSSDGMNGKRIATDKTFQRTRENGAEFGRACKAGKLMRDSLLEMLFGVADGRVTSRLTAEMLKVVKSDPTSDRGERTAALGNVQLLNDFEFNITSPLKKMFRADVVASLDKVAGSGKVNVPLFNPKRNLTVPDGATHYIFKLGISALDFNEGKRSQAFVISEVREVVNEDIAAEELTVALSTAAGELPLFLVFGIEFVQIVNGKKYTLQDASGSGLKMMAVG